MLMTDGPYWTVMTLYVAIVLAVEGVLIFFLLRQPLLRAFSATLLANLIPVGLLAVLTTQGDSASAVHAHGLIMDESDVLLRFGPLFFLLNFVAAAPVVLRVCKVPKDRRFVLCMLAVVGVTWPLGGRLFYCIDPLSACGPAPPTSRAKSDMRTMATAIEQYFEDNNAYPSAVPLESLAEPGVAEQLQRAGGDGMAAPAGLTTPTVYLPQLLPDRFAPGKLPYAYYADAKGWILVSPGPDKKYDVDPARDYNSSEMQPSARLLQKCWDPTNGTTSQGDIFRVRQW